MDDLAKLTLVTGGAASGKSRFAEGLLAGANAKLYLATAEAHDAEMAEKIRAHQAMRGNGWHTSEAPLDLPEALSIATGDQVVLVDCLTMWVSNLLLADRAIEPAFDALDFALATCPARIVCVTNEVGSGIVPDNSLARRFRTAQGQLNQRIAARADLVVAVMSGLPLTLKGTL